MWTRLVRLPTSGGKGGISCLFDLSLKKTQILRPPHAYFARGRRTLEEQECGERPRDLRQGKRSRRRHPCRRAARRIARGMTKAACRYSARRLHRVQWQDTPNAPAGADATGDSEWSTCSPPQAWSGKPCTDPAGPPRIAGKSKYTHRKARQALPCPDRRTSDNTCPSPAENSEQEKRSPSFTPYARRKKTRIQPPA